MAASYEKEHSWNFLFPAIAVLILVVVALAIIAGPIGSQKATYDKIRPREKDKMEKGEVFARVRKEILKAKPPGKRWTDLSDRDRQGMIESVYKKIVELGYAKDVEKTDVRTLVNEAYREKRIEEQD